MVKRGFGVRDLITWLRQCRFCNKKFNFNNNYIDAFIQMNCCYNNNAIHVILKIAELMQI